MHSSSGGPTFPFSIDSSVVRLAVGVEDGGPFRTTLPRDIGIADPSGRSLGDRSVGSTGGAGMTEN